MFQTFNYLPRSPQVSGACSIYYFLCAALLAISICEIWASVVLYQASNGFFIGAMYSGVSCGLVAVFGLSTLIKSRYSIAFFLAFTLLDAVSFIIAIIGTALTSQTLNALEAISSCAYYEKGAISCQSGVANLACVGTSSSFSDASDCESGTFGSSGHYYQNDIAEPSNDCWCVFESTSTNQCSTFTSIPYCPDMLYRYPDLIKMSFNFAWPLILLSATLLCFRNPEALDIIDPRSHRPIQLPVGEVMILAEGLERPRDVILTTAEWKPHFQLSTLNSTTNNAVTTQEVQQASAVVLRSRGGVEEEKKDDASESKTSAEDSHNQAASSIARSSQRIANNTVNNTVTSTINNQASSSWSIFGGFFYSSLTQTAPAPQQQPQPMVVTDVVIIDEDVFEDDLEQQQQQRVVREEEAKRR